MRWNAPVGLAASNRTLPAIRRPFLVLAVATVPMLPIWQASAAPPASACATTESTSTQSDPKCAAQPRAQAEASKPPITVEAAKRAVLERLTDPGSAVFRNLRMSSRSTHEGRPYAVCGEVDMKNRGGARVGYTRFYVPDDLEPLIVAGSDAETGAMKETLWQVVCAGDEGER